MTIKKLKYLFLSVTGLMLLPLVAFAGPTQQAAQEAAGFVEKLNEHILFPTIALLSAVAFLVFLWGCAQYFINAANDTARQEGVKNITYGIIGLVIMLSAFSILKIATNTFDLDEELDCANDPSGSGCAGVFELPSIASQTGGNTGGQTGGNTGGQTGGNTGE